MFFFYYFLITTYSLPYLCTGLVATIPMLSVAHSNVDATTVPQYLITGHPAQCGCLSKIICKGTKLFEYIVNKE